MQYSRPPFCTGRTKQSAKIIKNRRKPTSQPFSLPFPAFLAFSGFFGRVNEQIQHEIKLHPYPQPVNSDFVATTTTFPAMLVLVGDVFLRPLPLFLRCWYWSGMFFCDHYRFSCDIGTGRGCFSATTTAFAAILVLVGDCLLRPLPLLLRYWYWSGMFFCDHYRFCCDIGTGRGWLAATTATFAAILVLVKFCLQRPLPLLLRYWYWSSFVCSDHYRFCWDFGTGRVLFAVTTTAFAAILVLVAEGLCHLPIIV